MVTGMMANEHGSVMNIVLLVLLALTVIVFGMNMTSSTDARIAGNNQAHKVAFHASDSGISTAVKLVSRAINEREDPVEPGLHLWGEGSIQSTGDWFFREVNGYHSNRTDPEPEVSLTGREPGFSVNINPSGRKIMAGGGAEFSSGSEGQGANTMVTLSFVIYAQGSGPRNTRVDVEAGYRKVPGVAGGL